MISKLKERTKEVEEVIHELIGEERVPELKKPMEHLIKAGGKRIRPALCVLACEAVGGKKKDAVHPAAAIELIHNFSLVHDDIMDNDDLRRGMPTTHKVYGIAFAINGGDGLFAKAFQGIARAKLPPEKKEKVLNLFADAIFDVIEGQAMDMAFEKKEKVTTKDYLEMITRKTGRLIENAVEIGGVCGGATKEQEQALHKYGFAIGRAFQIQDDVMGIAGDPSKTGKAAGNDIREGKKTIIVLHALEHAKDATPLKKALGNKEATKEEIIKAVKFLEDTGSIQHAKDYAMQLSKDAKEAISILPDNEAKGILMDLADFTSTRSC